ncbi:P-loop containing nucleoside triphosphate hydrolase protein [Lipomyces japonicus]|uniref:P-loop containing nucleoside triphosphate hydrolase protein n=1 Tax=Lipomyces japonicus TaxID=56871 RepID=UPI0034CD02C2
MDTENRVPAYARPGSNANFTSAIPVPSTPSVSKIPQSQFTKPLQTSPLSLRGMGNKVLGDLRPEITNMPPPYMMTAPGSVMRKTAGTTSGTNGHLNLTKSINAARKPSSADAGRKISTKSSSSGSDRKTALANPPSGVRTSVRPKSAGGTHRQAEDFVRPFASVRSSSAQSGETNGRILSVNVNDLSGPRGMQARIDQIVSQFEERLGALEKEKDQSSDVQKQLEFEKLSLQLTINKLNAEIEDEKRRSRNEIDDLARALNLKLEEQTRLSRNQEDDIIRQHKITNESLVEQYKIEKQNNDVQYQMELQRLKNEAETEKQSLLKKLDTKENEIRQEFMERQNTIQREIDNYKQSIEQDRITSIENVKRFQTTLESTEKKLYEVQLELQRERELTATLNRKITEQSASTLSIESSSRVLQLRIQELEIEIRNRDAKVEEMKNYLTNAINSEQAIKQKLQKEETLRRILHNEVQELKGNIRVFCRVRPVSTKESAVEIKYPDETSQGREIQLIGPGNESALGSALGTVTNKTYGFSFDKVFLPEVSNEDVFGEISQLVQSALDGYNVCVFCYGQTGSGKTYTMSSDDGMIARAVDQVFATASNLREQGWTYTIEGQFLEIYNENVIDLLADSDSFDKKKLEIRNDPKESRIIVPDLTQILLDSPERVSALLKQAQKNRSVAATKANERSSRSHSVFIVTLHGVNPATNERREGTLNLIDLAGSERFDHSQSTGDRFKEMVSINKSLSCLKDVIVALGKDVNHIPYRNSKLTYLLQYSLGGNSKTLMFVNISPAKEHLSETINSLKFAKQVNNTHIGTAKRKSVY